MGICRVHPICQVLCCQCPALQSGIWMAVAPALTFPCLVIAFRPWTHMGPSTGDAEPLGWLMGGDAQCLRTRNPAQCAEVDPTSAAKKSV